MAYSQIAWFWEDVQVAAVAEKAVETPGSAHQRLQLLATDYCGCVPVGDDLSQNVSCFLRVLNMASGDKSTCPIQPSFLEAVHLRRSCGAPSRFILRRFGGDTAEARLITGRHVRDR